MLKKKPKNPPSLELPEEVPGVCVTSVFLGGKCDNPGPRRKLLGMMHAKIKSQGKHSLQDLQQYVKEEWKNVKQNYESKKELKDSDAEGDKLNDVISQVQQRT